MKGMRMKERKYGWAALVIIPVLVLLLFGLLRYLNWIQFYKVPTTNMEPTIKVGDIVYGSKLLKYERDAIVSYLAKPAPWEETKTEYVSIGRIVGLAGDRVQLKRGQLYVNETFVNDTLLRAYRFQIRSSDLNCSLNEYDKKHKVFQSSDTSYELNFTYPELQNYGILAKCKRMFYEDTTATELVDVWNTDAHRKWTYDNFGPVTIPKDCFFILGDNRSNSVDSRQRGFIGYRSLLTKIIR